MTIDLNSEGPDPDLRALLKAAEVNAETDFEIEFCASLREKFRVHGNRIMLCIALAGGFWERSECSI